MYSLYVFLTGSLTLSLQSARPARELRRYAQRGWRHGVAPGPGRSLEPQVGLEAVQSAFAPEAGLLVAAEGRARVEAVVRVRPDDAGAQPLRHPEDARPLLRPHARGQPVR